MKHHANEAELLHDVGALLDGGQPDKALEMLRTAGQQSKAVLNAYGVCLMRMGQIDKANELYRKLVLPSGGFYLDPNAPTVFKTNYATALLLGKHVDGCLGVLTEIAAPTHPAVVRLRAAIGTWKRTLGPLRRLLTFLFGARSANVPLPFQPGDL